MSTIAEKLKTTYLGLAGLTTSMRQLLSVGAKEITSQEINNKLGGVAKESTLQEVSSKLDNLNVDVDLSGVAKQGDNPEATLTAIYKLLIGSNEPSQDIPEGVAERLALILEFFGIKPIEGYEFMTAEEVCNTLEEIMTSMDLSLTTEQAQAITQVTLTQQ